MIPPALDAELDAMHTALTVLEPLDAAARRDVVTQLAATLDTGPTNADIEEGVNGAVAAGLLEEVT